MEDLRANALAFNYPAGTTVEDKFMLIYFLKQQLDKMRSTNLREQDYQYGQAQAAIPDNQINLPGEATAYTCKSKGNIP